MTTIEFSDVPYLEEILSYLPINATDKEDVNTYLKNITDSVLVNYSAEQYQFAYFGMHLLYMTYVYFSVKKISMILPERYRDAMVFARPYHGQKLDFNNLESVFDYSLVPEKDLPNILKIIELDNGQIRKISGLVDDRNDMAHASGRFTILTENSFDSAANRIHDSIKNIHSRMGLQIRQWFSNFIIRYCNNEFEEYDEISDVITEQMIEGFNLSVKELMVCNEMSIKNILIEKPNLKTSLQEFKQSLEDYCLGLIDII